MDIKIRKAKSSEFKEIAKIYQDSFNEKPYNENWTYKIALNKLKLFSKYTEIYSVYYKNKLVGFFVLNVSMWKPGDFAFGEEMAVKKEYRNKGITSYCMKLMEENCRKRNFKSFMFISNKKSKAYSLFKKLGYTESKTDTLFAKELQNGTSKRI